MSNENLWAPWRLDYLRSVVDPSSGPEPKPGCFLCDAGALPVGRPPAHPDAARHFVLLRDERGLIMLNRYPYTNHHLLVAGAGHRATLADHSPSERAGLMELIALGERLLQRAVQCQGMNIGINVGKAAGAGVPGHLHVHLVPRWAGDVNYMTTIGQVRVIPQALESSYGQLVEALRGLEG